MLEKQTGYTLLEVLVATALIGILLTVSTAIFINTIRSNNKTNITNEAKENSALITDSLEKDVRQSTQASVNAGGDTLTLTVFGSSVVWQCVIEASGQNGYVSRNGTTITNRDTKSGVSWDSSDTQKGCKFSLAGTSTNYLVKLDYTLIEGAGVHNASQDFNVKVQNQISIANRGY